MFSHAVLPYYPFTKVKSFTSNAMYRLYYLEVLAIFSNGYNQFKTNLIVGAKLIDAPIIAAKSGHEARLWGGRAVGCEEGGAALL